MNKRKFWTWAGKLALIAVPAAISGMTSYAKSKVEAEANAKASYETLQTAMKETREDVTALSKRCEGYEGQIAALKEERGRPVVLTMAAKLPPPPSPLMLSPPDAGTGSIGLGNLGVLGHGAGAGKIHKKRAELPERFEDAVQQYKTEAAKK